jgi:hypothetical protein
MGTTVAAALVAGRQSVYWVSANRGAATRQRAAGLTELPDLNAAAHLDAIVSVCPPDAALTLAECVMACGFSGIYVDANAVSPATARSIARVVDGRARCVDGGIVGPPATRAGSTRLYLSGPDASAVATWFEGSLLATRIVGSAVGSASALKMAYAAWTKGNAALLLAVCGLAEAEGVSDALLAEWALSQPGLEQRAAATAGGVAPKAWRFAGEMEEIAATFRAAGLPGGFHEAATAIYRRLAPFKDRADASLNEVITALNQSDES